MQAPLRTSRISQSLFLSMLQTQAIEGWLSDWLILHLYFFPNNQRYSALHIYRVHTQFISLVVCDGIFMMAEPKDKVEVEAGIGRVEEAQAYIGSGMWQFNVTRCWQDNI